MIAEWCPTEALAALGKNRLLYDPDLWRRPDDLGRVVSGATALIVRNQTRVSRELLQAGRRLRVVGRLGSGLDNIEVEALRERGLPLIWTPGANAHAVAEYTMAALLLIAHPLDRWNAATRAGRWEREPGTELVGKTLAVLGYGHVGREVAARARALGLYCRIHDRRMAAGWEDGCRFFDAPLEAATGADFLSIHLPYTPDTHHLVGLRILSVLKPGAHVINTSRGGVLDEPGLIAALEHGLGGAVLDVRTAEPPGPEDVLLRHSRVRHSPHVAGLTRESSVDIARRVLSGVAAVLSAKTV